MKKDFSYWYRLKFNQLDATPPKEVWENISSELDRNEVWVKVNNELEGIARRKTIYRSIAYVSVFLILIGLGGLFLTYQTDFKTVSLRELASGKSGYNSVNEKNVKSSAPQNIKQKPESVGKRISEPFFHFIDKEKIKQNVSSDNKTISEAENDFGNDQEKSIIKNNKPLVLKVKDENSTKNKIYKTEETSQKSPAKKQPNLENIVNTASDDLNKTRTQNTGYLLSNAYSENEPPKRVSLSNSEPIPNAYDSTLILQQTPVFLSLMVPLQVTLSEKRDSVKPVNLIDLKDYTPTKNLIIGNSFTLSNTWLLNSDTYNGFDKNNLNQTNFSFGNAYAALLGYSFSNKYTLQTEWLINNKQEQNYIIYCEGKQLQKQIKINYTNFNLLIKKKGNERTLKNKWPVTLNYIAGIQYGRIKSISRTVNDKTKSITHRYKKNNYSIILGAEYQLTIKQLWMVSAGIRADIGLRNIYAGTSKIPASFNRTYNSSLGVNIGVSYIIPFKL